MDRLELSAKCIVKVILITNLLLFTWLICSEQYEQSSLLLERKRSIELRCQQAAHFNSFKHSSIQKIAEDWNAKLRYYQQFNPIRVHPDIQTAEVIHCE